MLKFCQKGCGFLEKRLVYKEKLVSQEPDDCEEHGSCGVAGVIDLDGVSSNENVTLAIQAGANMPFRSGLSVDDQGKVFGADGSGVLMDTKDKGQWIDMLSERQQHKVHDSKDVQVAVFHFDRNFTDLDAEETRRAINDCFERRGLRVLDWEEVKTDESNIDPRRIPRIPKYHKLTFLVPGVDRQTDAQTLYRVARRINNRIRGVKLASLALDRVVFKGVLQGSELMRFFPILQLLKAIAAIVHDRFSTNVVTDQEQPFGSVAANGEINSIAAMRKALMNMAASWKFADKVLVNGGSDSAHLNDALELMLVNGVPLPEALIRLIPPALLKTDDPYVRQFLQASKRALGSFGMWEGPTAAFALDDEHFVVHKDRLGLRPVTYKELKYKDGKRTGRRLAVASEDGAIPFEYKDVIGTTKSLSAGNTLAAKLSGGKILTGADLMEDVLQHTGLNWQELSTSGLLVPKNLSTKEKIGVVKILGKEVKKDPVLSAQLAAFGWTDAKINSAIERIQTGKNIMTSMGFHGPLAILDPNLSNLNDLYLSRAAQITNPPFDPDGEADVIETDAYLGRQPEMTLENRAYPRIYPQWAMKSPIQTSANLQEMKDKSEEASINSGVEAPRVKEIDISFHGDYKAFLAKIAHIKKDVLKAASSHSSKSPSVIILSDRNAFKGDIASMAIPPVLLVQEINTELVNLGLDRNISLVVDSGTIRSAHDIGLLISQGASGVCPWLLEEVAKTADDKDQALFNLHKELNTALVRMMSKIGITTVLGARMGYWFSAVGLAPEVAKNGGAKTVSQVGGIGMELIYQSLVKAQLLRLADPEKWLADTTSKEDQKEGAYDDITREFFNQVAKPDIEAIRKLFNKAVADGDGLDVSNFPQLFDGSELSDEEISDIAFAIGTQRRLSKFLTLRDGLEVEHKYDEVTPELLAKAPKIKTILKALRMSHMSLGAHGKIAHAAMVRGCNKIGVMSASGEGGEEKTRRRNGPRPLDRSYAKQFGTAGWGVDRAYACEADEICIKISQGAKAGEGGSLPGEKVDGFIAEVRHVRIGTKLISPPPNHDIYSIEDLQARIRGFRALNPRAKISIKMASMPGLGPIAVGAVKAGADVLEISGFDGGSGSLDEQSSEHNGYPVEIGLAEAHQYLVKAGLRNRVKLVADGKMITAADFVKMRKMGADSIGLGTLLMAYVQCIACSNCHTNRCPRGITTNSTDRQRKHFVGKNEVVAISTEKLKIGEKVEEAILDEIQIEEGSEGVKNGLLALARAIQVELAKMDITEEEFKNMVGDVTGLYQKETGNPVIDSLDMEQIILATCSPPKWMTPEHAISDTSESVANIYVNPLGSRILEDCKDFLEGKVRNLELNYEIKNTDREVGVGLSGAIYEQMERLGLLDEDQVVTINTVGEGGHNYAAWAGNGMIFRHEGALNDSVAQGMSGNAKVVLRVHHDLREREGHVLVGNQACMWATGGTFYCPGKAGARLGVRNSGAVIVAEGATDYPFEYMTDGEGYMLDDWIGEIGSRMTGGKILAYDPDGSRRTRIAKDYVHTEEMQDMDFDSLKLRLEDYFKETKSPKAGRILTDWENEKLNFAKIMPN